jgi:hypothetical protein
MNQLRRSIADVPLPARMLPTLSGERFSIARLRPTRPAVLFLAHDAACSACRAKAGELAAAANQLAEFDGVGVALLPGPLTSSDLAVWKRTTPDLQVLIDEDRSWRRSILEVVERSDARTAMIVLDRYGAPRVVSFAEDADELPPIAEVPGWLSFIDQECALCSLGSDWPA